MQLCCLIPERRVPAATLRQCRRNPALRSAPSKVRLLQRSAVSFSDGLLDQTELQAHGADDGSEVPIECLAVLDAGTPRDVRYIGLCCSSFFG
jgi:hypothetical protein